MPLAVDEPSSLSDDERRDHHASHLVVRAHAERLARSYRTWGYPWVPGIFVVAMTCLVINSFSAQPMQSLLGVLLVALGVPVFQWRPAPVQPAVLPTLD